MTRWNWLLGQGFALNIVWSLAHGRLIGELHVHRVPGVVGLAWMALVLSACGGDATFGGGGDGGGNPGGGAVIPDDGAGPLLEARIGVLTGGNFTEGALAIGTPSLSAGGQTAVRLDVVDAQGLRLSNVPLTASFRSECANAGLSRFEPATLDRKSVV